MVNRIGLTKREDGYIVSTVEPPFMAWYGKYETAIGLGGGSGWRITGLCIVDKKLQNC